MLNILFVIIMWFFFVIIGLCLIDKIVCRSAINAILHFSSAYFVGGMYFLAICRVISGIFGNFRLGFFAAMLSGIAIAFLKRSELKNIVCSHEILKMVFMHLIAGSLICLVTSFWCTLTIIGNYDLQALLGSAHSGRYVNLAYDIVLRNNIPVVGQNYGESVLVACGLALGIQCPYFMLNLWIDITIASLLFFTYGILIHFGVEKVKAALSTLVIAFANTALSLNYIHIIDTGSPIIKSGYVDSHFGVVSCIIMIFVFGKILLQKYKLSCEDFTLVICFGFAYNMIGAYIGCIIAVLFICSLIFSFFRYKNKEIVIAGVCFAVSFIAGTTGGGIDKA